jgi:hypothetical protein
MLDTTRPFPEGDAQGGTERAADRLEPFPPETAALPVPGTALYGPRSMTLSEYRAALARALRELATLHLPKGKRRRSWRHKALDLERCGWMGHVLRCRGCGDLMRKSAAIEVGCALRTCPLCARRRANLLRVRLGRLWENGKRPRRMGLYLLTFTSRYDPSSEDDLSVEGLRRRRKLVKDAFRHVWRGYLKPRSSPSPRPLPRLPT